MYDREKMLTFGQALEAAKQGERIRRVQWRPRKRHLYMEDHFTAIMGMGGMQHSREYGKMMVMYHGPGYHQPGWTPSQQEMFSIDWEIVRDMKPSTLNDCQRKMVDAYALTYNRSSLRWESDYYCRECASYFTTDTFPDDDTLPVHFVCNCEDGMMMDPRTIGVRVIGPAILQDNGQYHIPIKIVEFKKVSTVFPVGGYLCIHANNGTGKFSLKMLVHGYVPDDTKDWKTFNGNTGVLSVEVLNGDVSAIEIGTQILIVEPLDKY